MKFRQMHELAKALEQLSYAIWLAHRDQGSLDNIDAEAMKLAKQAEDLLNQAMHMLDRPRGGQS